MRIKCDNSSMEMKSSRQASSRRCCKLVVQQSGEIWAGQKVRCLLGRMSEIKEVLHRGWGSVGEGPAAPGTQRSRRCERRGGDDRIDGEQRNSAHQLRRWLRESSVGFESMKT